MAGLRVRGEGWHQAAGYHYPGPVGSPGQKKKKIPGKTTRTTSQLSFAQLYCRLVHFRVCLFTSTGSERLGTPERNVIEKPVARGPASPPASALIEIHSLKIDLWKIFARSVLGVDFLILPALHTARGHGAASCGGAGTAGGGPGQRHQRRERAARHPGVAVAGLCLVAWHGACQSCLQPPDTGVPQPRGLLSRR